MPHRTLTHAAHLDLWPERVWVALEDALHRLLPHRLVLMVVEAVDAVAVVAVAAAGKALAVAARRGGGGRAGGGGASAGERRLDNRADQYNGPAQMADQSCCQEAIRAQRSQLEALGVLAVALLALDGLLGLPGHVGGRAREPRFDQRRL